MQQLTSRDYSKKKKNKNIILKHSYTANVCIRSFVRIDSIVNGVRIYGHRTHGNTALVYYSILADSKNEHLKKIGEKQKNMKKMKKDNQCLAAAKVDKAEENTKTKTISISNRNSCISSKIIFGNINKIDKRNI